MLCDCNIEEKNSLLLCTSKWLHRETIEWKFLHFFVQDTNRVSLKKLLGCLTQPLYNQEVYGRWQKHQQMCRHWSKDCCGLWQLAGCHLRDSLWDAIWGISLSTTACTSAPLPSSICLLSSLTIVWDRQGSQPNSLCVPHIEAQKLSLNCLYAEPSWNKQQ